MMTELLVPNKSKLEYILAKPFSEKSFDSELTLGSFLFIYRIR